MIREGVVAGPGAPCQASTMERSPFPTGPTRRSVGLTAAAFFLALPIRSAADPDVRSDSDGRLTVPVTLNGGPPLRFAVDSAANASVIASDLVARLGLPPGPEVEMNTLIARERVATARAGRLRCGAIAATDVVMMQGDRAGLGGIDGLLGTDLLASRRLVMSFRARRMHVASSRSSGAGFFDRDRPTVRYRAPAEQRFRNLMMIDASADGVPFKAIIDTGAGVTIINRALADQARARPVVLADGRRDQTVASPTGSARTAEAKLLPAMRFGDVTFRSIPVLVGDFHTFDVWGLAGRPAMLLGVDVLGLCRSVSIDLGRSEMLMEF